LYDSFVRITFDPDGAALVLVDYGTALHGPIEVDGNQIVQVQGFIRSLGTKAFPRGNESHTLTFDKAGIEDSLQDAFAANLTDSISLPRTKADVLLSLEDGRQWRLKDAAIRAWPVSMDNTRITRQSCEIQGGRLVTDEGTYAPGSVWGDISTLWEDL
jgi:hypothetical protein